MDQGRSSAVWAQTIAGKNDLTDQAWAVFKLLIPKQDHFVSVRKMGFRNVFNAIQIHAGSGLPVVLDPWLANLWRWSPEN